MKHRFGKKEKQRHGKREERIPGVAPAEIIRDDFRALDARELLRTTWEVEQAVLLQSIEGHAHEGHSLFYGRKFPNTTLDDICRALKLNPDVVKEDRQGLIDEVKEFVERVVAGERPITASNSKGEPLIRVGILRSIEIDPIGVLKGIYIGGLRDSPEIRKEAENRYGVHIGFGECYLVDQGVMHAMNLSGDILARQPHEHELQHFKERGLIVEEPGQDVSYMYIRHRTGPGASDDAGIVIAGKLYGLSAAIGSFLADAVDTLEKYVPVYSDQDSEIALIAGTCPGVNLGFDEAVRLAYLSAGSEVERDLTPDSSLRHLLEIDRRSDMCALESHLLYVAGKPYSRITLDHGQCTNIEFYQYVERRIASG